MKNLIGKILVIVIPIIAVIILLWPTYNVNNLEQKKREAEMNAMKAGNSTDSLKIIEAFNEQYGKDLQKAKASAIKLGLDLRGGMYVTMEVDLVRLIEESAQREAVDDLFEQIIAKTRQDAKLSDKDVIEVFMDNFNSMAKPKGKTLINYFDVGDLRDASEEKILEKLQDNAKSAIDQALEVIRQRIDKYGLTEPTIQKQGSRRIMLELPGVSNREEMLKLLQTTARLEFKLVKNNQDIVKTFFKIDRVLKMRKLRNKDNSNAVDSASLAANAQASQTTTEPAVANDSTKKDSTAIDSTKAEQKDTANPYAGLAEEEMRSRYLEDHPFTSLFETFLIPQGDDARRPIPINYIADNFPNGEYSFRIHASMLDKFNNYLSLKEIKALVPVDIQIVREAKPEQAFVKQDPNAKFYYFYALKRDPELTGDVITEARANFDPTTNQPMVTMGMNTDGSERWARITGANLKKRIAIVLDDQVYSAPNVQSKITGGNSQITGMADFEEAKLLEIVLKAGALKAPVEIIEERVVGPSLGEDSIYSGLMASLIAILLVFLFMGIYYSFGGFVAIVSVILNLLIVIASLAAFGGTLTLPGIAGLILTVGMAVDANVLIYERIREELYHGRSLRSAVDEGFSKALTAILDSNITTFITGMILYFLGTGPIQGFALTLMIGILATLFTQIVVSRAIINIFIIRGATHLNFGQPKVLATTEMERK